MRVNEDQAFAAAIKRRAELESLLLTAAQALEASGMTVREKRELAAELRAAASRRP